MQVLVGGFPDIYISMATVGNEIVHTSQDNNVINGFEPYNTFATDIYRK